MRRVGLLGGTYDPPHFGHLAAAEEARHRLELDLVLWLPAGNPPHKAAKAVSDAQHRAQMVALAIQGNPYFALSDIELRYEGPSYTVHTLERLRQQCPEDELVFLMGSDEFNSLETWYEAARIPQLARIGVLVRSGAPAHTERVEKALEGVRGRYQLALVPNLPISSSDLRERLRLGLPIRYLTPDAVIAYIEQHGLYLQ